MRARDYRFLLGSFILGACASQTRLAPEVSVPIEIDRAGAVVVAYPPPPAHVEVLEAAPKATECVWVDGQWAYKNQEFEWIPGAWVKRPVSCGFAKSRLWWEKSGPSTAQRYYRPGRWVLIEFPHTDCPMPPPCN